jgi:hypothetical protein
VVLERYDDDEGMKFAKDMCYNTIKTHTCNSSAASDSSPPITLSRPNSGLTGDAPTRAAKKQSISQKKKSQKLLFLPNL